MAKSIWNIVHYTAFKRY